MSSYTISDRAADAGEQVLPSPGEAMAKATADVSGAADASDPDLQRRCAENAALVRRAHAAFKAGDQATIAEIFAEDIEWVVPGHPDSMATTVDHGMQEVAGSFLTLMEATQGTYDAVGTDYLGGERTAIARAHVTAQRPGKEPLDMEEVVVFDVRDGKLARAVHIPFDQQRWDEFFMRDPS